DDLALPRAAVEPVVVHPVAAHEDVRAALQVELQRRVRGRELGHAVDQAVGPRAVRPGVPEGERRHGEGRPRAHGSHHALHGTMATTRLGREMRMAMPTGLGIVDLMLGIPSDDQTRVYDFMRPLFRDKESLSSFDFPVQYMFKDFPKVQRQEDYIGYTLSLMD